jgi:hemerythrin-like domain-containing protein
MKDALELIDQLIEEHKIVGEKAGALENAINDANMLSDLKQARDTFVPGDATRREGLQTLNNMLAAIEMWLDKHFSREETVLQPAVAQYGDESLNAALKSLLFEHSDLRDRMLHARKRVDELLGSSLDETRREAAARDLRVHINHSRKLLETHAARENHLLTEFRRHLKKATRGKEKLK